VQSTLTNTGTLLATYGATLDLSQASFDGITGTSFGGGVLEADTGSVIELAANTQIITDAGTITLNGAGGEIQALNTTTGTQATLDSTLATIAAGGRLNLLNGRNFTATANGGNFTVAGALALGGTTLTANTLTVNAGGNLQSSGTDSVVGTVVNAGAIIATGGSLTFLGTLTNAGQITLDAGALVLGNRATNNGTITVAGGVLTSALSIQGAGTIQLEAASTLSLLNGANPTQTIDFLGPNALLDLDHPASFLGTIAGFGATDTLDLTKPTGITETSFNYSNGVLTILDGSTVEASVNITGNYTTQNFAVGSDGHGGLFVTYK
jgi:hypothetical protein